MVFHFISSCRNEQECERFMKTVKLAASVLAREYGLSMTWGLAYLFLPNEKDRTLIERLSMIADSSGEYHPLLRAIHLVGGDMVHLPLNLKFQRCSQLTAEYIFHCLESMDACYATGEVGAILAPEERLFYSLNGTPAVYCHEEIGERFLHFSLKPLEEVKKQVGTDEEAYEQLRVLFGIPYAETPNMERTNTEPQHMETPPGTVFAQHFYERLGEAEGEEWLPEEEQRLMIHGTNLDSLYRYYESYVDEEKQALSRKAEEIKEEYIRIEWKQKAFENLEEMAKDILRGPYYADSMVAGFKGYMTDSLSKNMNYANNRYREEGDALHKKQSSTVRSFMNMRPLICLDAWG